MRRFFWVLIPISSLGLLFSIGLWACAIPQVWPSGLPVRLPIPHLLAFNIVLTLAVTIAATMTLRQMLALSSWWQLLAILIALGGVTVGAAKLLAMYEEKAARHLGESVIRSGRADGESRLRQTHRSRIQIYGDPGSGNWGMSVKGQFLPIWTINYTSEDGWFYVMD